MTREEWKTLDRLSRALGRKYEPAISEYASNLLLYGAAGYHVREDGEIAVATPDEIQAAMFRKTD